MPTTTTTVPRQRRRIAPQERERRRIAALAARDAQIARCTCCGAWRWRDTCRSCATTHHTQAAA